MFRFRLRPFGCIAVLSAAWLIGSGCNKPTDPLPGNPVKGKVSINGKPPNTYCSIEFVSVSNPEDKGEAGVDPSGTFAGRVPLGKCKVALKVSGAGGGGMTSGPPGGKGTPPGGFPKGGAGASGSPGGPTGPAGATAPPKMQGATEIPVKFTDVKTSGITVDVVLNQDLDIDFK